MLAGGGSTSLLNFSPSFRESLKAAQNWSLRALTHVSKNQAEQSSPLPQVSIPKTLGLWQHLQRKAWSKPSQRQEAVLRAVYKAFLMPLLLISYPFPWLGHMNHQNPESLNWIAAQIQKHRQLLLPRVTSTAVYPKQARSKRGTAGRCKLYQRRGVL